MDIEIVGRHALLFDDDTTAAFVNSQDALVEWNSLLIDRYDVRHLLFSPPPSRRRRNPQTSHSSSADAEIDYERYLDLPPPSGEEEADAKPEPVGGFSAVPFSYGNYEESNDQKNAEAESEGPGFHPPFPVPDSLIQNLPPTEKVHQIISRTALFVSKNGGQSEIVLRVKQGDNPTFGFLMPGHHLHPYFRFLVNHNDLLQSNEEKTSNTGALSLLGSVYGTGEDDDAGTEHPSSSSVQEDVATCKTKSMLPPGKDESNANHSLPVKEDAFISKKNSLTIAMKGGQSQTSSMKKSEKSSSSLSAIRASSLPPIPKAELMVLDPPSDMKKLVDKIVEFIMKNGRQFETVLMEQDRGHGRFPFLIPSNIFHPYYLKVLQKAQEAKLTVKSFHNENEDFRGHGVTKKTSKETGNSSMESSDIPIDSDRKEKFKMVINKPKKEASDSPSKATQEQPSVQVDAAQVAAILQAATRGMKPPNLGFLNGKFSGQFQSSNANEVDSNEQKLKAERLKRAKMFVAMLKSGTAPPKPEPQSDKKTESEKEHLDDEKRTKRKYRDRSRKDDDDDDDVNDDDDGDEREEKRSHRHRKKKHKSHESEERYKKRRHRSHHSSHKHDDMDKKEERDHKRKKKDRSPSSDEDESSRKNHHSSHDEGETDHKHSRRKHRSHKSSHRHKHRKSHSSRHREKNDAKDSNLERKDLEEGETSSKLSGQPKVGHAVDGVSREPSADVSSSFQGPRPKSSEVTEVPDDLRAKIRAMLMSTM